MIQNIMLQITYNLTFLQLKITNFCFWSQSRGRLEPPFFGWSRSQPMGSEPALRHWASGVGAAQKVIRYR